MRMTVSIAMAATLVVGLLGIESVRGQAAGAAATQPKPGAAAQVAVPEDVKDVPCEDLRAGGD